MSLVGCARVCSLAADWTLNAPRPRLLDARAVLAPPRTGLALPSGFRRPHIPKEPRMKKSDLSAQVATETSLSKAQASGVVDAVFSAISDALAGDETVVIAGFGTFSTKARAARQGRNPRTGESIAIAASKSPSFKAGKTLRDAARG